MNIKGLKSILRRVDEELMVLLYEASGKHLFRKPLGELMEDTAFDKYHCEGMTCTFNYDCDAKYESAEELKKQFLISVEVTTEADSSEKLTIHGFEFGFWGCDGMAYSNLMHKSLVYDIEHIRDYDKEAQREIRSMMKKYGEFSLNYIELYFDEDEVFEMYKDDPESVYDEIEDGNILAVDMFPILPKGMWLFG